MQCFVQFTVACWLVLVFLVSGTAHADDPLAKPKNATAREHLSQGNKLYRLREFEKAIDEYKAGALREDAHVFLYNLGQCYRQLGKYEDAIWHYERFLSRAAPTGDLKAAVDDFVRQMKGELEKKAMSQPPTEPAPDTPTTSTTDTPQPSAPLGLQARAEPWYSDGFGWGLSGVGLVGVSVGGYLLLDAADLDDQANVEDRQELRNQLRDKASSRRLAGTIIGLGGLGLLATGVVKLVIHTSPTGERTASSWGLGITTNGVQVFGRF